MHTGHRIGEGVSKTRWNHVGLIEEGSQMVCPS